MPKGYEKPPSTGFALALREFCREHGYAGRGAQAWLVEKTGKPSGLISKWWNGPEIPADVAFEEFIDRLAFDPSGQEALRTAWNVDREELSRARRNRRIARALKGPKPGQTTIGLADERLPQPLDLSPDLVSTLLLLRGDEAAQGLVNRALGLMNDLGWVRGAAVATGALLAETIAQAEARKPGGAVRPQHRAQAPGSAAKATRKDET